MPRANQQKRFRLLDKITTLELGRSITATKRLRADEDYLKDHFPKFPVMPGVLMLEALFQASSWLVRATDEFRKPMILLQEARSVKYANFLTPDQVLNVSAEIVKHGDSTTKLKVEGTVEGVTAVSGRLVLERFALSDRYPNHSPVDAFVLDFLKEEFADLRKP